jgi:hypothetical protein
MYDTLHALRIKGRATPPEIALVLGADAGTVEEQLRAMAAEGLAVERTTGRRPGWMLSAAGRERHGEEHAAQITADAKDGLAEHYQGFLAVNDRVKGACTSWQSATDDDHRFELLEELREVQEAVAPVLARSGAVVPRFAVYGDRLATALARVEEDPRYVVSPLVDSYHTVWFECHEDFIVTLGRSRSEEGSW